MNTPIRLLDLSRSTPWFMLMLVVALVAFWPSYLSRVPDYAAYTHAHAVSATIWILLLIAQPLAIRKRRKTLHRTTGQASYFIAPLVVTSIVLLAHNRIQRLEGEAYAIQTYILYLQISLAVLFSLSYALAILNRRSMPVHSRFMICTAMTLIDPITIRLMFWWNPAPGLNYNWVTFGFTDLVFLALIWLDRDARSGRWVFPTMLAVFMLAQLPVFFGLTGAPIWQAFAVWFTELPLT
ncbi:MAG: hypothetical protein ACRES3_11790 [Steroidobacteraceae bacterium]